MSVHRYKGKEITLSFEPALCIHAAECGTRLRSVFDPTRRPWVDPDAASKAEILAVVDRCPSGAIRAYEANNDTELLQEPAGEVCVNDDGPYYFRGDVRVETSDGGVIEGERFALCRCGKSENKPYCDNAHKEANFRDSTRLVAEGDVEGESVGNALTVKSIPDGPLMVSGTFAIDDGSGNRVTKKRAALCRCGASARKPYCDGSHSKIGFTAA